jgi:hypothetical protein
LTGHLSLSSIQASSIKKSKTANKVPSALISGWDKDLSTSAAAQKEEDDSMVRYGGIVADDEDDEVEHRSLILKGSSSKGKKVKALVSFRTAHVDIRNDLLKYSPFWSKLLSRHLLLLPRRRLMAA